MINSTKTNEKLLLRLILTALISLLILVCYGQPAIPEVSIDITTEEDGHYIRLSWDAVEDAELYHIYSATNPNLIDWGEPLATVGREETEYTTDLTVDELGRVYFFYITTYAEPVFPDWLVMVDGDLFYGNVTIDPFYISKYQVTQQQWINVMGTNPSHFADENGVPNEDNLPVEMVTWFDAIEYCNRLSIREGLTPAYSYNGRLNPNIWYEQWPGWNQDNNNHTNVLCDWEADGYRLPTEAEWHHAANGGRHPGPYTHSGSDDYNEVAWCRENSDNRTHPVGIKAPNGLGIYDMSGNVWEWCWDIHSPFYPSGGDNPRGATTGLYHAIRGGSWSHIADHCRVSTRHYNRFPTDRHNYTGFRVVRITP